MRRLATLLAASVLGIAAVWPQSFLPNARAAEPPAKVDLKAAPPDAQFVIYMRPAELAKSKMAEPVVAAFNEVLGELELGFSVAEFEEFQFCLIRAQNGERVAMMARTTTPRDWKKYYEGRGHQAVEYDGRPAWQIRNDLAVLADDRTLVLGTGEVVNRLLEGLDPNDRAEWTERWREAVKHPLAGMMQMSLVKPSGAQPNEARATLANEAKFGVMHGEVTAGGLKLTGVVETPSAAAAARVAPAAAQALVDFAHLIVRELDLPPDDSDKLTAQLSALLGSGELSTRGSSIDVKALVTPQMLEIFSDSAMQAGRRNR